MYLIGYDSVNITVMCTGKPRNSCELLHFDVCFIVAWNQTCSISQVCPYKMRFVSWVKRYIYIRYISNTVFYLVDCCKLHKLYSSRFPNSTVSNTQCCIYSHFYIFIYMHIYEKSMYLWLISQIGKLHRVLAQLLVGESDILGTLSCKITGLCISFDAF